MEKHKAIISINPVSESYGLKFNVVAFCLLKTHELAKLHLFSSMYPRLNKVVSLLTSTELCSAFLVIPLPVLLLWIIYLHRCSIYLLSQSFWRDGTSSVFFPTVFCTWKFLNKHFWLNKERMEKHINTLRHLSYKIIVIKVLIESDTGNTQ